MNRRATLAFLCSGVLAAPWRASAAELPRAAPSCRVTPIAGGPEIELERYRGSVLYLDFWASWCTPCIRSFAFLNELHRDFGERGLRILAVNLDRKPADAQRFLENHSARFPVYLDTGGRCPDAFDVRAMPSSFLIDRSGFIRHEHRGFRGGDAVMLRRVAVELLGESAQRA